MKVRVLIIVVVLTVLVAISAFISHQRPNKQLTERERLDQLGEMSREIDPRSFEPAFRGRKVPGWTGVPLDEEKRVWLFVDGEKGIATKYEDDVQLVTIPRQTKEIVLVVRRHFDDKGVRYLLDIGKIKDRDFQGLDLIGDGATKMPAEIVHRLPQLLMDITFHNKREHLEGDVVYGNTSQTVLVRFDFTK